MDSTNEPTGTSRDEGTLPTSKATTGADRDEVTYGGGIQPGGGMVEPNEFGEAVDEPDLPHDALAEGLSTGGAESSQGGAGMSQGGTGAGERPTAPPAGGTVDPEASPEGNLTGDRMGDVTGYRNSDRVVNTGVAEDESAQSDRPRST